jgi:hypothetical protein
MSRRIKVAALFSALVLGAFIVSCSEDSNYDQRTVVFVSSINENAPFLSDVLNQGDSLYMPHSTTVYKTDDDYIQEDRIAVVFHNKPYNGIIDPSTGALGSFLVTGYDVEFLPLGSDPVPVPPFSGKTSVLVPANEEVTAEILLVPYAAKQVSPLQPLQYHPGEIMSHARFTFHGHEIQANKEITFEAMVTVNFADPLTTKDNQQNP